MILSAEIIPNFPIHLCKRVGHLDQMELIPVHFLKVASSKVVAFPIVSASKKNPRTRYGILEKHSHLRSPFPLNFRSSEMFDHCDVDR